MSFSLFHNINGYDGNSADGDECNGDGGVGFSDGSTGGEAGSKYEYNEGCYQVDRYAVSDAGSVVIVVMLVVMVLTALMLLGEAMALFINLNLVRW